MKHAWRKQPRSCSTNGIYCICSEKWRREPEGSECRTLHKDCHALFTSRPARWEGSVPLHVHIHHVSATGASASLLLLYILSPAQHARFDVKRPSLHCFSPFTGLAPHRFARRRTRSLDLKLSRGGLSDAIRSRYHLRLLALTGSHTHLRSLF